MRIHEFSDLWLDCDNRLPRPIGGCTTVPTPSSRGSLCATLPQRCSSG